MAGETPVTGAASVGGAVLEALLDKLGPDLVRALSPTEGLQVTPHTFQAIEQERRWKIDEDVWKATSEGDKGFDDTKKNLDQEMKKTAKSNKNNALNNFAGGQQTVKDIELKKAIKDTAERPRLWSHEILTISMGAPGIKSTARIDVKYWANGLEIWAGFAGLKKASGFGSLFGNQANVILNGVTFGNKFPLSYYLTFYGYLNLVGPKFLEFKGAVILLSNGDIEPAYCESWSRDSTTIDSLQFKKDAGYILTLGD